MALPHATSRSACVNVDVLLAIVSLVVALLASPTSARLPPVDELIRNGLIRQDGGRTHALLVAGSSGYMNYRHQADVCHAYQILTQHGMKNDSIITFMYDDIANNWRNPEKGRIYNEPGGPDVYAGVKKDYTGKDVTPKNFLAALQGLTDEATGPVIEGTTSQDDIFVYFADHGGGGILGFPNLFGILPQSLHEADLEKAIKSMHAAGKYRRMIFYVEACFSGSMFSDWLPAGTNTYNLYVVTAATPFESSFACYASNKLHTYMGDCFSNHWMEDDDNFTKSFSQRTFADQFYAIRNSTTTSTVCQYGDVDLASQTLGEFESGGNTSGSSLSKTEKIKNDEALEPAVRSEDVSLVLAERFGTADAAAAVRSQRKATDQIAVRITSLVSTLEAGVDNVDFELVGDNTPAACEGHPNELACWQRCGTERHSLKECAGLCCGDAAPFFPKKCSNSNNGRGGMNCFMECCTGTGGGLMDTCLNSTSPQRAECTKRCCGEKICSSQQSSKLKAEFRQSVTACYKEFLQTLSEECPAFLGSDYGMIKYSHLVRNFCRSQSQNLDPNSAAMRRALRLIC